MRRAAALIPAAFCLAVFGAVSARAESIRIACDANPMFNAPEMTLTYEGDSEGTLTVNAPFGIIALPASKETREGTDDSGQPISATGIRAFGPGSVLMPDKAKLEFCVRTKLPSDQLADSDIVFATLMGCVSETPEGAAPVAINASAEIAIAPLLYVGLTRTYAEPTDLSVGTIAIDAYLSCAIEE